MDLNIRRFKESDLQLLYELLSDEEVMRYIEPPFSFEQTRAFFENAARNVRESFRTKEKKVKQC